MQQREPRPLVSEPRCREARAAWPTAAAPTTPEHRASAGSSVCRLRTPAGHWGLRSGPPRPQSPLSCRAADLWSLRFGFVPRRC